MPQRKRPPSVKRDEGREQRRRLAEVWHARHEAGESFGQIARTCGLTIDGHRVAAVVHEFHPPVRERSKA